MYGFYLKAKDGESSRLLFETHQHALEDFTDRLHELTEMPLEELQEPKSRQAVLNLIG